MPANGEYTRVLIVDDQVLIRVGLVALLRAAPNIEVVGAEAVALAAATGPHVPISSRSQHRRP